MTGPTTPPLRSERSRTSLVFRIPSDFGTRLASPPTAAWRTSSAAARPRSSMAALQLGCSRLAWNACRAPLRHRAHLKLFCFLFRWVDSSKFKAMLAAMGYITPEQLAGRVTTGKGRREGRTLAMRLNVFVPQTGTVWGPLLRKKSVTRLARWVSRASGLRSPMVSDHEHNWGSIGAGWVSRASGPVVSHGFRS